MGNITEGLFKAGLISKEKFRKQEAGEARREEKQQKGFENRDCSALAELSDVEDFRKTAKKVLLSSPSEIERVLDAAHELQKKLKTVNDVKAGKKLIWILFQIRDSIDDQTYKQRLKMLDRNLLSFKP